MTTATALEGVRRKLADGQTVTPTEYAAAKNSVELAEYAATVAAERAAADAAAELAARRSAFVERTLADAALEEGAATAARDQLHATVSSGLEIFVAAVQQRDRAVFETIAEAKALGLVDVDSAVAVVSSGPNRGLRIDGRRVTPSAGWRTPGERILTNALAEAHRAGRS